MLSGFLPGLIFVVFASGVIPAKDQMSVKEFWQIENQSEEKLDKVREPAQKFAQALLH